MQVGDGAQELPEENCCDVLTIIYHCKICKDAPPLKGLHDDAPGLIRLANDDFSALDNVGMGEAYQEIGLTGEYLLVLCWQVWLVEEDRLEHPLLSRVRVFYQPNLIKSGRLSGRLA